MVSPGPQSSLQVATAHSTSQYRGYRYHIASAPIQVSSDMEMFEGEEKSGFAPLVLFTHPGDGAREKYRDTKLKKVKQADFACAELHVGAA